MDNDYFPPGTSEREISIRRRVHRLAEFYRHAAMFVTIMILLWIVNAVQIHNSERALRWFSWWALWPTLGWGIGVLSHGLTVTPFWSFFSEDWEERKVKEIMQRNQP